MNTVGTVTLTAGTPQIVNVSRGARWVTLRNDSPNYLAVMCGPNAPASPSNASSYRMTIAPWSGDNYDTTSAFAPFDGVVYILATLPGGLALVGASSSRSLVSIDTYDHGESPPQPYSGISRQADMTSQTRVISIPVSPISNAAGNAFTGSGAIGNVQSSTPYPVNGTMVWRLYSIYVFWNALGQSGAITTPAYADFVLQYQRTNLGGNVGSPIIAVKFALMGVVTPFVFTPRNPITTPVDNSGGATAVFLQLLQTSNVAVPAGTQFIWSIQVDLDRNNTSGVPSEGGGAFGAVPTGVYTGSGGIY